MGKDKRITITELAKGISSSSACPMVESSKKKKLNKNKEHQIFCIKKKWNVERIEQTSR